MNKIWTSVCSQVLLSYTFSITKAITLLHQNISIIVIGILVIQILLRAEANTHTLHTTVETRQRKSFYFHKACIMLTIQFVNTLEYVCSIVD